MKSHRKETWPAFDHRSDFSERLAADGFATFDGSDFLMNAQTRLALSGLVASFDELPVDPTDAAGVRRRRYGRFVYVPWADALFEQPTVARADGEPVVEYFQPLSLNSVDGGCRRPFTPLHPSTSSNMALHELIRFDYRALPERPDWTGMPITVGVHQIALCPQRRKPAVSSPNHLHQDGEPFTYIHLMKRNNISGGTNYVAAPEHAGLHPDELDQSAIMARFTLENMLDSFVVDDQMVTHHVDGVCRAVEAEDAERAIFIIDFTPNMPQYG